jgi:hypothetical protein
MSDILFTDDDKFTGHVIAKSNELALSATRKTIRGSKYYFKHRHSFNMWCRVLCNNPIKPRVVEKLLTAPYCRTFLETIISLFREYASGNTKTNVLQHDGRPPHFGRQVTEFFKEKYKGRRIGGRGPLG